MTSLSRPVVMRLANVSQELGCPLSYPVRTPYWRCCDDPWVH
jgi:hypothetical protein